MTARAMVPPPRLREFRADFATASAGAQTALQYLGAARRQARERQTMEATRLAAIEVARALHRMHSTESYLDKYRNWRALCAAVGIGYKESYDLIKLVEVMENLQDAGVTAEGLTRRQAKVLARLAPAEQAEVMRQAQTEGDTTPAGLECLRRQLRAPIEAEAPRRRPEQPSNPLEPIRRSIALLHKLVGKLATAERCRELLGALEAAVNDAEPSAMGAARR
jgi:hypothetical protein